jgi:tagatose-6-phosphate ketose/aldose isomerase
MDELNRLVGLPHEVKIQKGLVFTPQEILQQPETWHSTYKLVKDQRRGLEDFLRRARVGDGEENPAVIYLVGAGTSDYIGRALASLLRQRLGSEVEAVPSTDLLTNMEDYFLPHRRFLWISFSRSGDSSEGVAAIEGALERYPGIHHLIVTCNREGRMARDFTGRPNLHCLILDDKVNDRGLAMTSSFTNMVIAGQLLAHLRNLPSYEPVLDDLIAAAEKFLPSAADPAEQLAARRFKKICFLGTGPLRATAVESALKVTELTAGRTLTWSESYLGIRHGPLSAVDDSTLIVGFLSGNERRRSYELDLISEIQSKRLSGRVVAIGSAEALENCPADILIPIHFSHAIDDFYRPPADVIFGQLLGLFSSLQAGLQPDTPSPKGAISRVVSEVKLY